MSTNKEVGTIVLTISDHLDWQDIEKHFWHIQEKVNAYVRFIESGEILEYKPDAKERGVVINLVLQNMPPTQLEDFVQKINKLLREVPTKLKYVHINDFV